MLPEPVRPSLAVKVTVPAVRVLSKNLTFRFTLAFASLVGPQPAPATQSTNAKSAKPPALNHDVDRITSLRKGCSLRGGGAIRQRKRCAEPPSTSAHLSVGAARRLPVGSKDLAAVRCAGRPPSVGVDATPEEANAPVHEHDVHPAR